MKTALPFLGILAIALSFCSKPDQSTDNLKVDSDRFSSYLISHTNGVLSATDQIRMVFKDSVASWNDPSKEPDFLVIRPKVSGQVRWENSQTAVFIPEEKLEPAQKYSVILDLAKLFEAVPKESRQYSFELETIEPNYELKVIGLATGNGGPTKLELNGSIETADQVDFIAVKKAFAAKQGNSLLPIEWKASSSGTQFPFVVKDITKTKGESSVSLTVNGPGIGVERVDTEEVTIPALNTFEVLSATVVNRNSKYISVLFSKNLNVDQDVKGLVSITPRERRLSTSVENNELKIFPNNNRDYTLELRIEPGLKSRDGTKLQEAFTKELVFNQPKPLVRFLKGNSATKSILPAEKGLTLPFQAVGLKAVQITVHKLFANNVPQYLQVNNLGQSNQLRRVARPILTKSVSLENQGVTDLNSWNTFNLDLSPYLRTEPGALYQIELNFTPRQSTFSCGEEPIEERTLSENYDEEAEPSFWDYSEENYYYSGYNWRDRDDPCTPSYYGTRRAIKKVLFASGLGLIAKGSEKGQYQLIVNDIATTRPIKSAEVEFFNYQNQLIDQVQTNAEGIATINNPSTKPFLAIARKGQEVGYLKLDKGSSLSLSNFNVGGSRIQNGLKGFIYGERGVWRPGDSIHVGFIVESSTTPLPKEYPVTMELSNPQGQVVRKITKAGANFGLYRFDFQTEPAAPTGDWELRARLGGASFSKKIKIETIKPNKLKVLVNLKKDRLTAKDKYLEGAIDVSWLSGAPVKNLDYEYDWQFTATKPNFEKYSTLHFDDPSTSYEVYQDQAFKGVLNEKGTAAFSAKLIKPSNAPAALNVQLSGKVFEEGGGFSISNKSTLYYPYQSYVGLLIPEGDRRGMLLSDTDHKVRVVTVDAEGKPISRSNLEVELYKLDWRWWWDNSSGTISNYISRSTVTPLSKGQLSTRNGEGTYTLRRNYPEWGRYLLRIKDPVSGHSAAQIFYLDWPGWAGRGKKGGMGGATMMEFDLPKDKVGIGEEIVVNIPSTKGNRLLISLESGSKILKTYWKETEEGQTTLRIPATAEMTPNVYVHLTMLQPYEQVENDLPIRLYGVENVEVYDPATKLTPVLKVPQSVRPGQEFQVSISENQGKAMAYTIAVVDEGILDLTNFTTPNPWTSFFAREALGIKTWDLYDDIIGAKTGNLGKLLAIGGGGPGELDLDKEIPRFEPVVRYYGPFVLEKGQTRTHAVQVPNYLGSLKTMVVASGDHAFGSANGVTKVRQSLMSQATAPRVVGPGERFKLPVSVIISDDAISSATVQIKTSGNISVKGNSNQTLSFSDAGEQLVYFELETGESLGQSKIEIIAQSGSQQSKSEINLKVIARNPPLVQVADQAISPAQDWKTYYKPMGLVGTNSAVVEVSTLPPLNLEHRLNYLIRYPHGCLEQTVSSVFPQLHLGSLLELSPGRKTEIQNNINAGINRLRSFQLSDGNFSYWPGTGNIHGWGNIYAGHFLVEAKAAGYAVPDGMLSQWLRTQKSNANNWVNENQEDPLIQAYRLYVLAKGGEAALSAMNRMKENGNLSATTKWRLAAAFAERGFNDAAAQLVRDVSTTPEERDSHRHSTFGSATRNEAIILETLVDLDRSGQAFELAQSIARELGNYDRWHSTQTTSYGLIALAKYAGKYSAGKEMNVSIDTGSGSERVKTGKYVHQLTLNNPDEAENLMVRNEGSAPVFARLIRRGVPLSGGDQAGSNNLTMTVKYIDQDGKELKVGELYQGQSFKAIVTVSNPGILGDYKEMALTQLFPAGWEIRNRRLNNTDFATKGVEYVDIRDDRVMHYFDIAANTKKEFTVELVAAYLGEYYLPSIQCEAMYNGKVYANTNGRWVKVQK